ncbi:MAG: exodeoxyribonuclease VII small subunit [Rickettsiales bacterium]|nr:exodeoxyribonuclease VII small subunit [Rickettsiales bacterium]
MTKKPAKNFTRKLAEMDFESAMTRLEEIVEILSSQKINLNSMIDLYEESNILKEYCQTRLQEAKMKIETITKK